MRRAVQAAFGVWIIAVGLCACGGQVRLVLAAVTLLAGFAVDDAIAAVTNDLAFSYVSAGAVVVVGVVAVVAGLTEVSAVHHPTEMIAAARRLARPVVAVGTGVGIILVPIVAGLSGIDDSVPATRFSTVRTAVTRLP